MGEPASIMTSHHAPCALRTHRRTWGLSQQELAEILGFASRTHVSRLENGERAPRLETALACSTLFGVSLGELFPQFAAEIGEQLRKRISQLEEGYSNTTSPLRTRKKELFARAVGAPNPYEEAQSAAV